MFKKRRSPLDVMYINNDDECMMYKVGQFIKLKKDNGYILWKIISIDKFGLAKIRRVDDGHREKFSSRSLGRFILASSLMIVDGYKSKKKIIRSSKKLQEAIFCPKCNSKADYYDKWFNGDELEIVCECECGCGWECKI